MKDVVEEGMPEAGAARSSQSVILQAEQVYKVYPKVPHPVLDYLDLHMTEGEFVSLIGPSGCGKTTFLRIVAGLTSPTSGDIYIGGLRSTGPSPEKALAFQQFNLFPWRTAIGNAAYGLEVQGMRRRDAREKAHEYLDLVGLRDFANHYTAELSGGMQQRVGIARALAVEPRLLLMDEPFGSVDALTRERLQSELLRIVGLKGLTVLFVTHSIDEAIILSDRVITMGVQPGRILREFPVDLPRPRADYDVHAHPEYARIRHEAWSLLETEIERQDEKAQA